MLSHKRLTSLDPLIPHRLDASPMTLLRDQTFFYMCNQPASKLYELQPR